MKGLLTVSMIVKNEERFLGECLSSIKDIADEIIVVDTGSTDRTIEIARSFGARIVEIEWPNDFAQARNVGLELVKTPWVLVLDADEELIQDDISVLQKAITDPTADAYNLRIVSIMDRAEDISESYVTRLVRSHPKIRFRGAVHEQLLDSVAEQRMRVGPLNVRLLHKGYLTAVVQGRNKSERNRTLLASHLKNHPNDAYMLWQMAQTLLGTSEFRQALAMAKRAINNIARDHALWVVFQATLARTYDATGQPKKAIRILQEGKIAFPNYTDFYYQEGNIRLRLNQWEAAEKLFRRCLQLGEASDFLMTDTGIGGFKSLYKLSQALFQQGKSQEALAHLLLAIKTHPSYRDAWQGIFTILAGTPVEAVLNALVLTIPLETIAETISQWSNRTRDEEWLLTAAKNRLESPNL